MPNEVGLTDPEILARLYHQKNQPHFSFLKEIDGIFSAIIYDSKLQQIHLLTDHYGLRHLYWTKFNDCLIWSSEIKAFLAFPGFSPTIDRQAVKEFFPIAHLLENRTWFEGVELVPSGTVLTWKIATNQLISHQYWWWDQIKPFTGKIDEQEVVEELGCLFSQAVERRTDKTEKIGLTLSGGLDSRATLAAMPDYGNPIHALTFGKLNCDDARFAKKAAEVKGATHHLFEINHENWLAPRLEGVWWTDGQLDILDMHSLIVFEKVRDFFHINLNAFAGDLILGGSYLKSVSEFDSPINEMNAAKRMRCNPRIISRNDMEKYQSLKKQDYYSLQNHVRRFTFGGTKLFLTVTEQRKPFYDNRLIEYVYSLPDSLRFNSHIYKKMLLSRYPDFFQSIPWQKTGVPISSLKLIEKTVFFGKRVKNRVLREMPRFALQYNNPNNYTDYPNWIRQEPVRSFFTQKLRSSSAIYPEYIDKNRVIKELEYHLKGKDFSRNLCRYLTFELWLQQVFEGKYRMAD